jgi:hypothetical protein
MTIVLNSEFKELIKDKHNANIVNYLNTKGYGLEETILEIAKELSLLHNLSLGASIEVVTYDAGFTLDCLSNCMVDKTNIDFKLLACLMENDELEYQLSVNI